MRDKLLKIITLGLGVTFFNSCSILSNYREKRIEEKVRAELESFYDAYPNIPNMYYRMREQFVEGELKRRELERELWYNEDLYSEEEKKLLLELKKPYSAMSPTLQDEKN